MDLLDYLQNLEEMEFNQIAPKTFYPLWRKNLQEHKLNAILLLPPNIQDKLMEDFKFRRVKIDNYERILKEIRSEYHSKFMKEANQEKDNIFYKNVGVSAGIDIALGIINTIK